MATGSIKHSPSCSKWPRDQTPQLRNVEVLGYRSCLRATAAPLLLAQSLQQQQTEAEHERNGGHLHLGRNLPRVQEQCAALVLKTLQMPFKRKVPLKATSPSSKTPPELSVFLIFSALVAYCEIHYSKYAQRWGPSFSQSKYAVTKCSKTSVLFVRISNTSPTIFVPFFLLPPYNPTSVSHLLVEREMNCYFQHLCNNSVTSNWIS